MAGLRSLPLVWMACVSGPVADDPEPSCDPGAVEPPPETCVEATLGETGGTLTLDEATLTVPEGALIESTSVQLCATGGPSGVRSPSPALSRTFTLGPDALSLQAPAELTLDHALDEALSAVLFVPGADGSLRRSFHHASETPTRAAGRLYRPGACEIRSDPRVATPYAPVRTDQVDILIVIDTSCSMQMEYAVVMGEVLDLGAQLAASALDYRLGFTSMDMDDEVTLYGTKGTLTRHQVGAPTAPPRWIDPSFTDASLRDPALGQLLPYPGGSATTRGLLAAYAAVEDRQADNDDFVRADAHFAVVFVADGDDASALPTEEDVPQSLTDAEFVTWFQALKDAPATAAAYGILHPVDDAVFQAVLAQTSPSAAADIRKPESWQETVFQPLLDVVTTEAMPLDEVPVAGTIEAWWVPPVAEPTPLAIDEVVYDGDANTLQVSLGDRTADEVVVLYAAP